MTNNRKQGHLCAFLTIFIWGTTFISTKILLTDMTPLQILFTRFVIGYLTLWIMYPHRCTLEDKKLERWFAGAGLCGITLYYLLENIALLYTQTTNVGVIISIAPFFTAFLSSKIMKESSKGRFFYIGFALAMLGILWRCIGFASSSCLVHLFSALSQTFYFSYDNHWHNTQNLLLWFTLHDTNHSNARYLSRFTNLAWWLACNRQFTIFRLWCLGIMLCDLEQGSIYFRFYTDKCLYLLSTCHYRINIFSYLTRIHQYEKTDRNHLYYMRLIFITRFAKERKHCITYS